ncbi:hypothetical protein HPB51_006479 [Rhipicephalus microplus]|uniref:Uncharacterized protein n=1 Tax=Rhipicephalus microplus TaxID=6941 RepID=A0A9J6E6E0_RHIMP|nr:hypothetical protein HPB51_006479 [Rhipicephalus microplus]
MQPPQPGFDPATCGSAAEYLSHWTTVAGPPEISAVRCSLTCTSIAEYTGLHRFVSMETRPPPPARAYTPSGTGVGTSAVSRGPCGARRALLQPNDGRHSGVDGGARILPRRLDEDTGGDTSDELPVAEAEGVFGRQIVRCHGGVHASSTASLVVHDLGQTADFVKQTALGSRRLSDGGQNASRRKTEDWQADDAGKVDGTGKQTFLPEASPEAVQEPVEEEPAGLSERCARPSSSRERRGVAGSRRLAPRARVWLCGGGGAALLSASETFRRKRSKRSV